MNDDYSKLIRKHYKQVAEEDGASESSTMKDQFIRNSETRLISMFLENAIKGSDKPEKDIRVADIGCGNGYTLSRLTKKYPEAKFVGYEYTPELREIAAERFIYNDNVNIKAGDIRCSFNGVDHYDVCYTQRVIINLLDASDQKEAVKNIVDCVNQNGKMLFVESFQSGMDELNQARGEFALSAIEKAHHNLLLNDTFFSWLENLGTISIEEIENNFLSSYFYTARVLHPLLLGDLPFSRNSHFVRYISSNIRENYGNYSPVQAYAFSKK